MMQIQKNATQCWLWLIVVVLLVNATGFFSPVIGDAYTYAMLGKNIVVSGNWVDLTYRGQPWLDKPHFPFWMTAISFKLFGISTFTYILPGFIFNLIGACYTYRLAKLLYSETIGILAVLLYVTSLHLLISSIDVRAEAYLLGEMMPAQLKETTMDPARRTLLRVAVDIADPEGTRDAVDALMGTKPEARFRFIQERAAFAENLDI